MKVGVIIVAAGSGVRMGADVPKQFLLLDGRPILCRSIERFAMALPTAKIVVVLSCSEFGRWDELCKEYDMRVAHTVCAGGQVRFDSVKAGLSHLRDTDFIAVHDGVRCLLTSELITSTLDVARRCGTAIPVVSAVDSFRAVLPDGSSRIVDRSVLRAVQTPQIFRSDLLIDAYEQPYCSSFTDDASVVESNGIEIALCDGEQRNIKITTPLDMIFAKTIIEKSEAL